MICVHTENQNQVGPCLFALCEVSVLADSTLGHPLYHLTDVPSQLKLPIRQAPQGHLRAEGFPALYQNLKACAPFPTSLNKWKWEWVSSPKLGEFCITTSITEHSAVAFCNKDNEWMINYIYFSYVLACKHQLLSILFTFLNTLYI